MPLHWWGLYSITKQITVIAFVMVTFKRDEQLDIWVFLVELTCTLKSILILGNGVFKIERKQGLKFRNMETSFYNSLHVDFVKDLKMF